MNIEKLYQHFKDFPIVSTDTRKIEPNSLFFALKGEQFNGNAFAQEALAKGAAFAIIDEAEYNIGDSTLLVKDVLRTLQNLARHHRKQCEVKVLALTGSNGKTTTKELLNAVLSRTHNTIATLGNLNNHIGVPLTLLRIQSDTDIAIIEMGANHRGEIASLCEIALPDFGYITNFGKAHLEGFGSEEGVIKGKSELYNYLRSTRGHIFLNADDPIQRKSTNSYIKKYGFSGSDSQFYRIKFLEADPYVKLQVEDQKINTKLVGKYNFENCAAAVLIGKYFNVPLEDIKEALELYVPRNNRSEILSKHGNTVILDAYNANPTSVEAAINNLVSMSGVRKIAILGDMLELGNSSLKEHERIARLAMEQGLDKIYLFGDVFASTENDLPKFTDFNTMVSTLKKEMPENAVILIKGSRGMALERLIKAIWEQEEAN